jgi:hypothetical protein
MSGKQLKRVLKTPKEKEHSLMDETIKLYKYFQKLIQKTSTSYEDVEKVDNLIYRWIKVIEIKFFQIIKPLARFIYNNRNPMKNFKHKRGNKKNDKTVFKRK